MNAKQVKKLLLSEENYLDQLNSAWFWANDYPNQPEYCGRVTTDRRAIALGIASEVGVNTLRQMTAEQCLHWLTIVWKQIHEYFDQCAAVKGKRTGLSYTVTKYNGKKYGNVTRLMHCKKYQYAPRVSQGTDGLTITWIGKEHYYPFLFTPISGDIPPQWDKQGYAQEKVK